MPTMTSRNAEKTPLTTTGDATQSGVREWTASGGGTAFPSNASRSESIPERIAPPKGYPDDEWQDEGFFAVPEDLRAVYVEVAEMGEGSITKWRNVPPTLKISIPGPKGERREEPVEYETWAHITRRDRARQVIVTRARAEEYRRENARECPVCGAVQNWRDMRLVKAGSIQILACVADAPDLQAELHAQERLASGRPRGAVVREVAERLTANSDVPPLELRDES
ncbi:hypothetical protein QNO21_07590 [Microbacterium sp. zg-Y818]|uniref:hypothetical protein n=1 Tax=unclassified Microbacterium TaxID=2609290 RepID=UPI00214CC1A8|nr:MULTISPECIES: hypothetical protein [unclassified Microbacterium]MCR2801167.1 hypothetical protein [Microbacterium sp. zg.Y818]WIM21003.1 hypothetical protein QNO21_07590 [Microbacterium sp. zg-Y818]